MNNDNLYVLTTEMVPVPVVRGIRFNRFRLAGINMAYEDYARSPFLVLRNIRSKKYTVNDAFIAGFLCDCGVAGYAECFNLYRIFVKAVCITDVLVMYDYEARAVIEEPVLCTFVPLFRICMKPKKEGIDRANSQPREDGKPSNNKNSLPSSSDFYNPVQPEKPQQKQKKRGKNDQQNEKS